MPRLDWTRLTPHLERLFELSDEERSAYIDEACSDDEKLRAELSRLIALDRGERTFLRPPTLPRSAGTLPAGANELLERLASRTTDARYERKGEVARGGMGAILKVWDEDLRRSLAMKVTLDAVDEPGSTPSIDASTLGRFLEEAQVTGQLDHPGIVPVHELGIDSDGKVYFTMRLVKGETLAEIFELAKKEQDGWTRARVLGVILKVCEAMAYAHSKSVIHRDLKPSNVMVGRFGEVYVMDWGVAKVLGTEDTHDLRLENVDATEVLRTERSESDSATPLVTMDGTVVGTPAYMSPEQARGEVDTIDARTDVYAIGAMLYHLLTDRMPYVPPDARPGAHLILRWVLEGPPQPVSEIAHDVPAELEAICEKAMSRERSERYADVLALAEDLRAFSEGGDVRAYAPSLGRRVMRYWRRHSFHARAGILTTYASLAALVLLVLMPPSRDATRTDSILLFVGLPLAVVFLAGAVLILSSLFVPGRKALPILSIVPGVAVYSLLAVMVFGIRDETEPLSSPQARALASSVNAYAWRVVDPDRDDESRDLDLALRFARAGVALQPENPSTHDTLAWALFANGLHEEALQSSEKALELAGDSARSDYAHYLERLRDAIEETRGGK